jgi:hypothetical protein
MEFLVNISNVDDSYINHPENFLELEEEDFFIFSAGSTDVADGKPIPTSEQLNQAMTILPEGGESIISKIFVADMSAGIIREIKLAGRQNKRYVFCVSIEASTITEPVLELWDTNSYNTYNFQILGSGTPANSNIRGIVTTNAAPGSDSWLGKALAGGSDDNRLLLNDGDGKLLIAKDLYFNLYAKVQYNFTTDFESPKFLVKYHIGL